jgi:uncharacterized phage-associated protein
MYKSFMNFCTKKKLHKLLYRAGEVCIKAYGEPLKQDLDLNEPL